MSSKKKLFVTDAEQKAAVDKMYEGVECDDWDKRLVQDGFGELDADGHFEWYDTLEEIKGNGLETFEIWEDNSGGCYDRLIEAAVEMYEGPWNESEIIRIVIEAIAKKHLGGVH